MLVGYGITALVTPLYALVRVPVHVLFCRFFERIGKGLRAAPRDSLISGSVTRQDAGKNFGFHKAMDNSGAIIGPLGAFLLLRFFPLNYTNIFLIATIPALLGVVVIALFIRDAKVQKSAAPKISLKQLPRRFYFFLLIIFIFTLGNSADALLLVKTAETGIDKAYIPFVYMIFNVVSVFLAVPIGKLTDRIGRERMIIPGFLIYALTYFLFGRFSTISIFIGLFAMYGLYSAMVDGSQKAMISDIVKKEMRGTGFGLYHAILGVTLLPASLIAGRLYDRVGSGAPFYFGAVMALLAAALMTVFALSGRKATR